MGYLKLQIRKLFRHTTRYVLARPKLRKPAVMVLARFPGLKSRLSRLHAGASVVLGAPAKIAHLTPRARRIYALMQAAQRECASDEGASVPDMNAVREGVAGQQDAWLNMLKEFRSLQDMKLPPGHRPKLAYVSPLPPERSGIADYSAELLPCLAAYYDIDVIIAQAKISTPWVHAHCGIQTSDYFLQNAHVYDRVIYHFGNSIYHQHMYELLAQVPGVVVLHEFYLGVIPHYLQANDISPHAFSRAIYLSHGYAALRVSFQTGQIAEMMRKYPANLEVLQQAQQVIVHSRHAKNLADEWYGLAEDWTVIPLLRAPASGISRDQARQALGLKPDDFLVCSFGLIGATKLNHLLLEAWLNSRLAQNCMLVFVGDEQQGEYGAQLKQAIRNSGLCIRITGWTDMATFRNYLAAADIAVQLRAFSRGETSAAMLDCMNHALPTIVNAHGSFAELPADAVWMLSDKFEQKELVVAMETLWQDGRKRTSLGSRAQEIIRSLHAPGACAEQYAEAIEQGHVRARHGAEALARNITRHYRPSDTECMAIAQAIDRTLPLAKAKRQLLVDVSVTCRKDWKTGIQRVVRALVWELIMSPPPGYRVEPVYCTDEGGLWHYRYARDWTSAALGFSGGWMIEEPVEYAAGDVMLIADLTSGFAVEAERAGVFESLKHDGVKLHFIVYDLLPIQMPEFFPPGQTVFQEWLKAVTRVADGAICISQSVAQDLEFWISNARLQRICTMRIDWFHLGADIGNSMPSSGLPEHAEQILARLVAVPTFLMVGTIEPRKGHLQTLKAFTQLWQEGYDINLVIAGCEGWHGMPDNMRRTIPEIVAQLHHHPELGKRLLWLEGISDEYLENVYAASDCLIAASEGEGFGLPLIEAAQHKLAVMARDIPVFREVAGEYACYFAGLEPCQLSAAIKAWLAQDDHGPAELPWLTWKQSTEMLLDKLGLTR